MNRREFLKIGSMGMMAVALAAARELPRIKATVTSTMYDMSRVIANGYFDEGKSHEELVNFLSIVVATEAA